MFRVLLSILKNESRFTAVEYGIMAGVDRSRCGADGHEDLDSRLAPLGRVGGAPLIRLWPRRASTWGRGMPDALGGFRHPSTRGDFSAEHHCGGSPSQAAPLRT
jgi:hypothetical protein